MLYGNIAAIDQTPRSNDAVSDAAGVAASHANSGQTVEYALTSRTLLLPTDDPTAAFRRTAGLCLETKPRLRSPRAERSARRFTATPSLFQKSHKAMSNMEQDRWSRVKGRLRSSVGEDVYTSWFARMDLESVQDESVRLSVPTRFLKSWIQAHYAERVLSCWQAEMPEVHRIDLTVRSPMRCVTPAKEAPAPARSAPPRAVRRPARAGAARDRDRAGLRQP